MSLSAQKSETLLKNLHGWTKTPWRIRFFCSSNGKAFDELAVWIQNIMKFKIHKPVEEIEKALDWSKVAVTDQLLLTVLRRHKTDWKPAYVFFNWASKRGEKTGFSPSPRSHNELIDTLGRMRRFDEAHQVLENMCKRGCLVSEETYTILLNRLAAAHKVDEAIALYHRREELGLEVNSAAFVKLLMWLCRYKDVETAEHLFYSKYSEFGTDIRAWNTILYGWYVRGHVSEARRVWKDIVASKIRPDLFTFGIFINVLAKSGRLGLALKLFRGMRQNGFPPDTAICNTLIDALCKKRRVPEALKLFAAMKRRGCQPSLATYNTLIKSMCAIRRMNKAYEILDEMEKRKGSVSPNHVTFSFFLRSLKNPDEVPGLLYRMECNGIRISFDIYNMVFKMYLNWGCHEKAKETWTQMENCGAGPDERSYTVLIHWLCEQGRTIDAFRFYKEMKSKGMIPEPRTEKLMSPLNVGSQSTEVENPSYGSGREYGF